MCGFTLEGKFTNAFGTAGMQRHPAIVIGCGGLGTAALYRLSRRLGPGVLGIEQFRLGHVRGGSQDHSRIIRLVQHKCEYAALASAAYRAWREVEEASGQRLVTITGGLVIEDAAYRAMANTGSRNLNGYAAVLTHLREFTPQSFPVFMWHGIHNFYGFPVYGEVATKLGQHMGGSETTAATRTFEPDPVRQLRYREFVDRHIPGFAATELYSKTCLYTLPPDRNLVLDALPEDPRIVVAVGAGHAYKFAALIGTILTELVCDGTSTHPIDAFMLDRPALAVGAVRRTFHI